MATGDLLSGEADGSAPSDATAGAGATDDAGPATVRVQVVTVPAGAQVLQLGEPTSLLGSTPLALTRSLGTKLRVRLERDGFTSQELDLSFAESTTLRVVLVASAAPSGPVVDKVGAKPARRTRPSRGRTRRPRTTKSKTGQVSPSKRAATKVGDQPVKPAPKAVKKPLKKPTPGLVDDLM